MIDFSCSEKFATFALIGKFMVCPSQSTMWQKNFEYALSFSLFYTIWQDLKKANLESTLESGVDVGQGKM